MISDLKQLPFLPEILVPAVLVPLALFAIVIAIKPDIVLAPFKRLRKELEKETINREALFAGSNAPKNMDFKLYKVNWPVTYLQFRLISAVICIILAVLSIKYLYNPKLAVVSAAVWYVFAHTIVNLRYQKKYKNVIDEQAQLSLQLLAEAYDKTEDLIDAIVWIIPSTDYPLKGEYERVVKEYRTGKDMDECLKEFADRCDNKDIDMFIQGILLARHYGTDVSMVIEETSNVIRERIELKDELENELKGKGFTIYLFMVGVPVLLVLLFMYSEGARDVFLYSSKGQNLLCLSVIIEFISWYLYQKRGVTDKI